SPALMTTPQPTSTLFPYTTLFRSQTKAVLITIGIGAFNPKKLPAPGSEHFLGKGLAYFVPEIKKYLGKRVVIVGGGDSALDWVRSEEHTSELQSLRHLVCRLLLEK